MPRELARIVGTTDGVNVVIDDRWAAHFPEGQLEQIEFLVRHINRAEGERLEDHLKGIGHDRAALGA